MTEIVAVIPARGGSKGIPRKNLALFGGETLLARTIKEAQKSQYISSFVVNTDDDEIQAEAERYNTIVLRRPAELGSDIAEVDPLLLWTLTELYPSIKPTIFVLLYCTAPLRTYEDIDRTIDLVLNKGYDSALTLVKDHSYLWKKENGGEFSPTNYEPRNRAARQKEKWNQFIENKAVYAFTVAGFVREHCRIHGRVGAVLMPANRSIDIDAIEDLILAAKLAGVDHELAKNL